LRVSDSEDGIFQASILPPTNSSLAAENPKRRKRNKREAEEPAMAFCFLRSEKGV